jgi:hypothetical protein
MYTDRIILRDETCCVCDDGIRDVHAFSFYTGACVHGVKICHHDNLFCDPFYNETHHDVNVSIRTGSHLRVEMIAFRVGGDVVCHQSPARRRRLKKQE